MPSWIAAIGDRIGGTELFLFARYPQEIKNRDVWQPLSLRLRQIILFWHEDWVMNFLRHRSQPVLVQELANVDRIVQLKKC